MKAAEHTIAESTAERPQKGKVIAIGRAWLDSMVKRHGQPNPAGNKFYVPFLSVRHVYLDLLISDEAAQCSRMMKLNTFRKDVWRRRSNVSCLKGTV